MKEITNARALDDDEDVVVATQAGDGGLAGVANTKCPISGKELADIDNPVMCVSNITLHNRLTTGDCVPNEREGNSKIRTHLFLVHTFLHMLCVVSRWCMFPIPVLQ